jgi:hypothetical protein
MGAMAQIGEGAVIEAAPHPEAVAVPVESHQGHQEQIEVPGKSDVLATAAWLRDAEAVWA